MNTVGKNVNLRSRLQEEKPYVFEKLQEYYRQYQAGNYGLALIELAYNYSCNLNCRHCFASRLKSDLRPMNLQDVKQLADQADALGVFQIHLQGGEPLFWKDLPELIEAIGPQRFHLSVTTNAVLFQPDTAVYLKNLGVDKLSVSIDSFDPREHDANRNQEGVYNKAISALFNARDAGMQANMNVLVTRQNARSRMLEDIAAFAQENGFTTLFIVATPTGNWEGRFDLMIDEDDAIYLKELAAKYPAIKRDLWKAYDIDYGCRTVNGLIYITESGEVLSCPFIHISLGNVVQEPLETILHRAWNIRHFHDYSGKCLAGEDRDFVRNYIAKTYGKPFPVKFTDVFSDSDYLTSPDRSLT